MNQFMLLGAAVRCQQLKPISKERLEEIERWERQQEAARKELEWLEQMPEELILVESFDDVKDIEPTTVKEDNYLFDNDEIVF